MTDEIIYTGGEAADIARHVVQLIAETLGRGPTKARAYLDGDLVTIVLSETLTKPERRLLDHGHNDAVLTARRAMHETMREPLTDVVAEVVGRPVRSLHLDHDLHADVLAIVCVFDGEQPPVSDAGADRPA